MILDTETGIVTTTAKDGTVSKRPLTDVERAEVESLAKKQKQGRESQLEAVKAESEAERLFDELTASEEPRIERVEVQDREFFIQRGGLDSYMLFDMLRRGKNGKVDTTTREGVRRIMAAMLYVSVVKGASDDSPWFDTYRLAEKYVTHPKTKALAHELYINCSERADFLERATPSVSQSSEPPSDSTMTTSGENPPSSPGSSEESSNSDSETEQP